MPGYSEELKVGVSLRDVEMCKEDYLPDNDRDFKCIIPTCLSNQAAYAVGDYQICLTLSNEPAGGSETWNECTDIHIGKYPDVDDCEEDTDTGSDSDADSDGDAGVDNDGGVDTDTGTGTEIPDPFEAFANCWSDQMYLDNGKCEGTVVAADTDAVDCQWKRNGQDIAGATNCDTLDDHMLDPGTYSYALRITDGTQTVTSEEEDVEIAYDTPVISGANVVNNYVGQSQMVVEFEKESDSCNNKPTMYVLGEHDLVDGNGDPLEFTLEQDGYLISVNALDNVQSYELTMWLCTDANLNDVIDDIETVCGSILLAGDIEEFSP
ncbi:hypothetical protein ACFL96_15475 [Thermoproteota archaeon]